MSTRGLGTIFIILSSFAPAAAQAAAVESVQVVVGNEVDVADGSDVLYFENVIQLQKSWVSFDRAIHTMYLGTELLFEPSVPEGTTETRWAFDTQAAVIGYRYRTYLPDWYNFNVRLRVPFHAPNAPDRSHFDRLQLSVEPLTIRKSWNLFTIHDQSKVTLQTDGIEYGNKIRLIDVTPDLEFPIAAYVGDEIRFKKGFESGGRVRNDILVGLASNVYDWLHVGVELMYHLDTKAELSRSFIGEVYVELSFDIFFDNTSGGASVTDRPERPAYEGEGS